MVSRSEISTEAHDGGLQFARHGDHFRVHAINVVTRKQRGLINQHASFIARGDDEVCRLERFDLMGRNVQRKFVTLPASGCELYLMTTKDVVGIVPLT